MAVASKGMIPRDFQHGVELWYRSGHVSMYRKTVVVMCATAVGPKKGEQPHHILEKIIIITIKNTE